MPGNGRLGPMHLPPALLSPRNAARAPMDRSCATESGTPPYPATGHATDATPPGDLPSGPMGAGTTWGTPGGTDGTAPIMTLQELERRTIEAALARYGVDTLGKRQAAAALGISVATLYRKLKEAGS